MSQPTSNTGRNQSQRGGHGGRRGWRGRFRGRGAYNQQSRQSTVNTQRAPIVQRDHINCPFKKWSTYLVDEVYTPNSEFVNTITALYRYFKNNLHQFNKEEVEEQKEVLLDLHALKTNTDLQEHLPTLCEDIRNNPSRMIPALAMVIHESFLDDQFEESPQSITVFFDVPYLNVRLLNYEPITPLKSLKSSYFGKLVSIKGTVVRVGNIKPILTKMAFQCNSCGIQQVLSITEGKYETPTSCLGDDCRARSFTPLRSSPKTETVNWQLIKLQEIMLDDQREAGRIPRNIECELTHGLVDNCTPGDMVTITGIVKVSKNEENKFRGGGKGNSMYLLFIQAISISNDKEIKESGNAEENNDFSIKDLYAIQEIQSEKELFRLVVGSLCPAIYGHELVKAGMVLALFGGTKKFTDEKNAIPVRSDPHVLVVGDPGLGKSQLLQAVSNVAPRGVYVCGNTTTTSGLTVTLTKESGSSDYALEAGALVLADKGCCCIDEFDKMTDQHQALLEAMEQQSISLAKAGIVCSLPARTSIIAAANPVGGHYNKAKTVSENLKMNSALLSRFDLVFILLDKPDEEMDCILSEHVMALHSDDPKDLSFRAIPATPSVRTTTQNLNQSVTVQRDGPDKKPGLLQLWESENSLKKMLKIKRGENFDPVPPQLLRKYIQYARKYVNPKLSTDASKILQEFYLNLRKQQQGPDSTPITTRQLEAMIRLTEARARLELREKANVNDAREVVEIMKNSLVDTCSTENGELVFDRSINGSGMSKRNQCKYFVAELNKIAEREKSNLFTTEQMYRIAKQLNINMKNFDDFISTLNTQNFLLKKGFRTYELQTAVW
eukprot:TCONS_00007630-protein